MEGDKGDTTLAIKASGVKVEVRHGTKTDDNEWTPICKLNDFFSNNIDHELSRISILQLENCNLNALPSNIPKLNLKQLILTRNKLREVPSCLYSSLNALELLDLSHNFIESFDIEPACSCTIVSLKLNDNKIWNFPHWILNLRCPKLEEVVYNNNRVVDLRASHQLNIKKLEMTNCQLLDADFTFFKSLRNLEVLNISNELPVLPHENNFKNINELFMNTWWSNLKLLNLSNHSVSILPKGIFWIVSLTELHLNNCDLSWIPSEIQFLTTLKILDVSHNTICSLPSELAVLEELKVIRAPFNSISSVPAFAQDLEILDLYDNLLEAYPFCAENVKLIDLEQNYCDTKNKDAYEQKRDQLRQMFSYSRKIGFKELPIIPPKEECSMSQVSESESEDSLKYEYSSDSDNWDEEKPVPMVMPKNPDITPSDDEWDGRENREVENKKEILSKFENHEEWFFCDAEE